MSTIRVGIEETKIISLSERNLLTEYFIIAHKLCKAAGSVTSAVTRA